MGRDPAEKKASRAAPVPGPMAEQGAWVAMVDLPPKPRPQPPPQPLRPEPYYPPKLNYWGELQG